MLGPSGTGIDEDVGRLDVPMDQPVGVGGIQGRGDRGEQGDDPVAGQRSLPLENGAQISRGHEPHREVKHAVGRARRVNGNDVRVVDRRDGAGLPDEPLAELPVVGQRGREDLQGDRPAERLVVGAEYHRHPAGADP